MSYGVFLANQLDGKISTLERQLAEQTEQLRQKDETIRALADALELLRKTAHNDVARAKALPLVDAVLRGNGRLP